MIDDLKYNDYAGRLNRLLDLRMSRFPDDYKYDKWNNIVRNMPGGGFDDLPRDEFVDAVDLQLKDIISRIESGFGRYLSIGPGWYRLVAHLNYQLQILDPTYKVLQVKEKFGGLRYYVAYTEGTTEAYQDICQTLIAYAESKSYNICEDCGIQITERPEQNGGWISTLCIPCDEARKPLVP